MKSWEETKISNIECHTQVHQVSSCHFVTFGAAYHLIEQQTVQMVGLSVSSNASSFELRSIMNYGETGKPEDCDSF